MQNSKTKLLQECEGKCTQNSDCAENLVCYNGEFGDYIPGCKGTTNHTKYCVKGTHLEEEPTSAGTSEASTGTNEASAGASAAGTVANVVACQGEWKSYCDAESGKQTYVFSVTRKAENGGTPCDAEGGETKREEDCKVDCVGHWSEPTCNLGRGKRTRTFSITTTSKNGGQVCEAKDEASGKSFCRKDGETEDVADCTVDCVGEWTKSGNCNPEDGKQTFTYDIITTKKNGGNACDYETGDTKQEECAVDCIGSWSKSECDASSGTRTYTFNITTAARNGGKECSSKHGDTAREYCEPEPNKTICSQERGSIKDAQREINKYEKCEECKFGTELGSTGTFTCENNDTTKCFLSKSPHECRSLEVWKNDGSKTYPAEVVEGKSKRKDNVLAPSRKFIYTRVRGIKI